MAERSVRKSLSPSRVAAVIGIGIAAGFLAGLFGVGGGMIIVPALVLILGMNQRQAAATSLASIVVTASFGTISYASVGQVSLPAMLLVSTGAIAGAAIGTWLLSILPERVLPWIFVALAATIIVLQQFHQPVRAAEIEITVLSAVAMIGVGLVSGIMAGLSNHGNEGIGNDDIELTGLEEDGDNNPR